MSALVTALRLTPHGAHDVVRIWARGGMAGDLTFNRGDGELFCATLAVAVGLHETPTEQPAVDRRWHVAHQGACTP